jgi:hypothetical protein
MPNWKDYLKEIYYDIEHPAAFSGPDKLYKIVKKEGHHKIGKYKINKWLQDQDAYSLQKPVRYKFKRNRVITAGIDDLWDVDLADVSNLEKYNENVKFLLIIIDIFSRYLWVIPLQNKKHASVIEGFTEVFSLGRKPKHIRSDKGSEFNNRWVKAFLKKAGVNYFVTHNETKANYAERVIRTLKTMMYRYFTHKQTYRYKDILRDLVSNYNHSPHRSLNGRTPVEITKEVEAIVWKEQYIDTLKVKKKIKIKDEVQKHKKIGKRYKYKIGDYVRLSHLRQPFQRDYQEKWTEEIFIIKERKYRAGIPVYKVTDYDKDPVQGTFYQSELQKVNKDKDSLWRVDKIIKKRKRKGKEEWFVSFVGWPKKFNMWLPKENVQVV